MPKLPKTKRQRHLNRNRVLNDAKPAPEVKTVKYERVVSVRRDFRYKQQHYILLFASSKDEGCCDLVQLKSGSIHTAFTLKENITNYAFAVDELLCKLYLASSIQTKGTIKTFDFSFAPPDPSGFRRLVVQDSEPVVNELNFCSEGSSYMPILMIAPLGELLWWVQVDKTNAKNKIISETLRHRVAAIPSINKHWTYSFTDIFSMSHSPQREFAFLKSNSQLMVHCWPQWYTPRQKNSSVFVVFAIQYDPFSIGNGPVRIIEPLATSDLLDRTVLRSFKSLFDRASARLVGRGFKYWFLGFASCPGKPQFLAIRSQHLSLDCLEKEKPRHQIWQPQEDPTYRDIIMKKHVSELFGKFVRLENDWIERGTYTAHFSVNNTQHLIVDLPLPPAFKDYRFCAHCKTPEIGKRRNSSRKRIANLRVCRQCKTQGLHLRWWQYPCHFCSQQCVAAAWSQHRHLHNK